MSKIISLTAENVKRLHAVTITPSGNLVIVGGKNGQGKTSVLDSIAMALGGADEVPTMPVRRGEQKASVVLDLGDIIVKRTFTAREGGETTSALVVENKENMRAQAPQAILDKLTGKVTFDPLAFISMDAAKQAATLKRLVGLDLSGLDAQRLKIYSERTLVNRDHDRESARLGLMPQHPDTPAEEQSVSDLAAELEAAATNNRTCEIWANDKRVAGERVEKAKQLVAAIDSDIASFEARIAKLREQRVGAKAAVEREVVAFVKQSDLAATKAPVDITPIREKLAGVELVNSKVRANKARATAAKALQEIKAKSDALTKQIEGIDNEKDAKLAAVKFPVAGLSFTTDGSVAFNGVPFDQASAAERMRASVAIAAAMNPKLRVMLVRDASLLDEDGLTQLAKLAEEFDLQVWAERVGHGAECSVIIEDGSVAAAAGKEAA